MISDEFRAIVKALTGDLYVASWEEKGSHIDVECQHNSKHSHTIRFSLDDSDLTIKGVQIQSLEVPNYGRDGGLAHIDRVNRVCFGLSAIGTVQDVVPALHRLFPFSHGVRL